MHYYTFASTPAGTLLFVSNGEVITGIHWEVFKHIPKVAKDWIEDKTKFTQVLNQFDDYFAGKRATFTVPYMLQGTDFQKAVWKELEKIPYGSSTTYQAIAKAIGKPKAVRAVGTAVGNNPIAIIVPCHRVLASSMKLGGFAGGLESKRYLLAREGIPFSN